MTAPDPWLVELLRAYPGGALADLERAAAAWAKLANAERFAAVFWLHAWIAASPHRPRLPPPVVYLTGRRWELLSAGEARP